MAVGFALASHDKTYEDLVIRFAGPFVYITGPGHCGVVDRGIFALPRPERLRRVHSTMLVENEFLSPYGMRSVSKFHERNPFELNAHGPEYRVDYLRAGANTGASAATPTRGGRSGCRSMP